MSEEDEGPPTVEMVRYYLYTLASRLPQIVVYDHPTDAPDEYMARLWLTLPEPVAMPFTMRCNKLGPLQDYLESLGLVKLMRSEGDDPKIMETWL